MFIMHIIIIIVSVKLFYREPTNLNFVAHSKSNDYTLLFFVPFYFNHRDASEMWTQSAALEKSEN